MLMYFSGIASPQEANMLHQAKVSHVLGDLWDYENFVMFPHRAVDSGAYRLHKQGKSVSVDDYADRIRRLSGEHDFIISADVFGNPDQSMVNFKALKSMILPVTPVWQWGGNRADLDYYFKYSPLVCIGGLVPAMRAKDKDTLKMLIEMVGEWREFACYFHVLGLNWLKAIEELKPILQSFDTSKWLDGARYGHVIFTNTRTGHLSQAPARSIKEYQHLDRAERCILSARNLADFVAA